MEAAAENTQSGQLGLICVLQSQRPGLESGSVMIYLSSRVDGTSVKLVLVNGGCHMHIQHWHCNSLKDAVPHGLGIGILGPSWLHLGWGGRVGLGDVVLLKEGCPWGERARRLQVPHASLSLLSLLPACSL